MPSSTCCGDANNINDSFHSLAPEVYLSDSPASRRRRTWMTARSTTGFPCRNPPIHSRSILNWSAMTVYIILCCLNAWNDTVYTDWVYHVMVQLFEKWEALRWLQCASLAQVLRGGRNYFLRRSALILLRATICLLLVDVFKAPLLMPVRTLTKNLHEVLTSEIASCCCCCCMMKMTLPQDNFLLIILVPFKRFMEEPCLCSSMMICHELLTAENDLDYNSTQNTFTFLYTPSCTRYIQASIVKSLGT